MSGRHLIKGGCVLTLGARSANHAEADVLIEDGRIAEIGPRLRARDAEVVEAEGAIVMPGFVDAHRHAWKSLFRNAGAGHDPAGLGERHGPDDVYAAVLIGLLGAVEAGITTVVDWADVDASCTEAVLQAHADAGLRTVLVHAAPAWEAGAGDAALRALVSARGMQPTPLTTIAAGTRAGVSEADAVARQWATARELGLRIHAHAGTTPADTGAVAALGERGLLGADVTLVHCTTLGDGDLDAVAAHGPGIVLTPSTEMAGGLGSPPLQKLIDRGLRPGLGVDDEVLAPGDLFAQLRMAQSVQHATLFDLKLAGKGGVPNLLSTRDVIRYGTADGARVAGVADVAGSLEVGKAADVVVLRTDQANISPVNDPIGAVVWGMDASNVSWVFVAGRALVRDGALEADVERARTLAVQARDRVAAAAGRLAGAPGGSR